MKSFQKIPLILGLAIVYNSPSFANTATENTRSTKANNKNVVNEILPKSIVEFSVGRSTQNINDNSFNAQNYSSFIQTTDDTDQSFKLSYIRHIRKTVYLELGYIDLGDTGSDIDIKTLPNQTDESVANDINSSLPWRGSGIMFGVGYKRKLAPRTNVVLGVGAFVWKDEHEVLINNTPYKFTEKGIDPYAHLGLRYNLNAKISLGADYQHFFVPKEDINRIAISFSYNFN